MIKTLFILMFVFTISGAGNIDLDTICNEAKKSHKHVLVFLHKPACGYCERMIEFTLPDEEIAQKIQKNFIFVDIDISDPGKVNFNNFKGTKREFAISLGYDIYPTSAFIDENREVVYLQPGYKNKDKFLNILRFIESRSYEDMGIEDFK